MDGVISRNDIHNEIIFKDFIGKVRSTPYTFHTLDTTIDKYKNVLEDNGAKNGQSVLIGLPAGLEQTAMIFAVIELGMSIIIADYHRDDSFKTIEYTDPKTEILSPIDFFIISKRSENTYRNPANKKFIYYVDKSETTIFLSDYNDEFDTTPNKKILATPDSVVLKCTSSGTTGTPKYIEHTHHFIKTVAMRNTVFYDNTVALVYNLNHGSSVATYYLPALFSNRVQTIKNISYSDPHVMYSKRTKKELFNDVNHLMMPYGHELMLFLRSVSPNTIVYTLSTISDVIYQRYEKGKVKDIISFFGCNETSGPTLINQASDSNFLPERYKQHDDFYKINVDEGTLNVTLPVYDCTVDTKDIFGLTGEYYHFKGRNDILRIHGKCIDMNRYVSIVQRIADADIVFDIVQQKIYLAFWNVKNNPDYKKKLDKINRILGIISNDYHLIDKHALLDKNNFIYGVKIDQELLREYFRTHVN